MEFGDLIYSLRKRWLLSLLVLVIALSMSAWTFASTKPTQQSTSAVLLIPPATVDNPNPLLGLDSNLSQLAVVLAATLESDATHQALARLSATASYSIETLVASTSPNVAQLSARLSFTATDFNGQVARRTAEGLVTESSKQLSRLQAQASIAASTKARVLTLSNASQPVFTGNGRLRASAITCAGILLLGAVVIIVLDSAWTRVVAGRVMRPRRRKRSLLGETSSADESATRVLAPKRRVWLP